MNRVAGPEDSGDLEGPAGVVPIGQHWQIRYATDNPATYARQLDFFQIELVADGGILEKKACHTTGIPDVNKEYKTHYLIPFARLENNAPVDQGRYRRDLRGAVALMGVGGVGSLWRRRWF